MLLTHDPVVFNQYCAILSQVILIDSYGTMPAIFPEVTIYHSRVLFVHAGPVTSVPHFNVCHLCMCVEQRERKTGTTVM